MEDDDVPDTRVYVSGLPPNMTSEHLGAHFAMRYQVTDAVVVPGRRIGFVGFRNYTLAKSAVKYFDKSYIRLSKISVEIAKPIELKRDSGSQAAPVSQKAARQYSQSATPGQLVQESGSTQASSFQPYVPLNATSTSNKRKRGLDSQEQQEGLNEFMQVMQTVGPKPTWANGTDVGTAAMDAEPQNAQTIPSDDTAGGSLKKLKKKDKKNKKNTKDQNSESGLAAKHGSLLAQDEKAIKQKSARTQETPDPRDISEKHVALVEDENRAQSGREAIRKKEKKRKKATKESDNHEVEAQIEDGANDVPSTKTKKEKRPKKSEKSREEKGGVASLGASSGLDQDKTDRAQLDDTRNDSDWLRARTSRVLGLVEDDELREPPPANATPESRDSPSDSDHDIEPQIPASSPAQQHDVEELVVNGRLFIRNLPFNANQSDIENLFSKYGKVDEVHIVQDPRASTNKGLAYVQYGDSGSAAQAIRKLDGVSFQGRLLHVLPSLDKKSRQLNEYEISKLPLKKQKEIKRKREAATTTFSWNSMYMNPDAVLSSVADRLGVGKAELLDPTSSDAAVKQAHAETHVIQETKSYLTKKGINVDAFKNSSRDDRTLLVKNFPFGVTTDDLRQLLEPYGHVSQLLMPSTGTIALVQYSQASEAAQALKQLAYKNLKGSVLFLEKGPRGLFDQHPGGKVGEVQQPASVQDNVQKQEGIPESRIGTASSTLFVRNLDFATTTIQLNEAFEPLAGFLSAKVKTKTDPKRPGEVLSMGFGFVNFRTSSQAQAAMSVMNGHKLGNHELIVEVSRKTTDAAEERRRDDIGKKLEAKQTKIIIKNLPFEASKKDVRSLFGAYGQLRSVRVPKKFDNSTRGFAFADFVSAKEAENAIAALTNTHLLGRRLVLEFASGDAIDPEDEIRAMEQRVSQQTNVVNMSRLTGSGRKKFTVDARDDQDP